MDTYYSVTSGNAEALLGKVSQLASSYLEVIVSGPRALLYLCHGVTEHTQRYKVLADHLAGNKILVFGHDHGTSMLHAYNYMLAIVGKHTALNSVEWKCYE